MASWYGRQNNGPLHMNLVGKRKENKIEIEKNLKKMVLSLWNGGKRMKIKEFERKKGKKERKEKGKGCCSNACLGRKKKSKGEGS